MRRVQSYVKRLHPAQQDASEDVIHEAVARLLRVVLPPSVWWSTIEHRNAKSVAEGGKRKKRGVKAGVPDILLCWRGVLHCIELKNRAGSLSPAQIDQRHEILNAGGRWALCRSVDDVTAQLARWGIPTRVAGYNPRMACPIEPVCTMGGN